MAVRVTHTLNDLARDVAAAPAKEAVKMPAAIDKIGDCGMSVFKIDATRKSGRHGVHYPDSATRDSRYGAGSWETVYGPDESKPQGGMDFEHGSGRQSTPHLSVAISHDAVKTRLGKIGEVYDGGVYQ